MALTTEQLSRVVDEHIEHRAGRTPTRSLQALRAAPIEVEGITLYPPGIGQITLLEEIESPIWTSMQSGAEEVQLTTRDMVRAIYIYAATLEADEALRQGREEFERAAMAWITHCLPLEKFPAVMGAIAQMNAQATSTIPSPDRPASRPTQKAKGKAQKGQAADPLA